MKTIKLPYPATFQELLEASVKTKPTARTKPKDETPKREAKPATEPTP